MQGCRRAPGGEDARCPLFVRDIVIETPAVKRVPPAPAVPERCGWRGSALLAYWNVSPVTEAPPVATKRACGPFAGARCAVALMCCDGYGFALVKDTAAGLQHRCHMRCPGLCGWQGLGMGTEIRVLFLRSLSLPEESWGSGFPETPCLAACLCQLVVMKMRALCAGFLKFQVQILGDLGGKDLSP